MAFSIIFIITLFDIPILIFKDIIYFPSKNISECWFSNERASDIISKIDFIRDSIVPFSLISIFTILMIKFIYFSRKKLFTRNKIFPRNKNLISKDLKFSVTVVCLNICFFILKAPYSIIVNIVVVDYMKDLVDDDNFRIILELSKLFANSVYSVNFFIYLGLNSLFRNEFISIVKVNKTKVRFKQGIIKF